MTRENRDDGLQSLRLVFSALTLFLGEDLPSNFEDIKPVNVYEANGDEGDNWKAHLNHQGKVWVITPLHYSTIGGSNKIRFASGGGRWDDRTGPLNKNADACWQKRKYKLAERTNKRHVTNKQTGHQTYTMNEYTPNEDKPKYALCQITVDHENYAYARPPSSSQQPKSKKIDHTDNNNNNSWDKGETSLSHESMQQGGQFENATGYNNKSNLEMYIGQIARAEELSEFKKHFSNAFIVQVFSQKMDEKPAASPKEHSTEAAVLRNVRKRSYGTNMKTIMETDVSTLKQKQPKVEILVLKEFVNSPSSVNQNNGRQSILSNNLGYKQMFESNSSREKGEQISHHSNYIGTSTSSGATFEQWSADPSPDNDILGLFSSCGSRHDASYKLDDRSLVETGDRLGRKVFEQNVPDPQTSSHNFNKNSREPTDNQNRIETDPTTSIFATTKGRLDHQMVEPNAHFQEPKLYHNINGNSTEPVSNNNHLLSCNQNISAPGHSTSNYETFVGRSDQQMFKPNANVEDPNNFSLHFTANSTEPTENSNHLPSYNQNTIALGPNKNNYAGTFDWINNMDLLDTIY